VVVRRSVWLVGGFAIAVASCGSNAHDGSEQLSREDLGAEWPLTVEDGELHCYRGIVTFTADEATYDDNDLHMSLSPLLVRGIELCFGR
jgi:hypothetical protein